MAIGDCCVLEAGQTVPADGYICNERGDLTLDFSMINGQTTDVYRHYRDEVQQGSIVKMGAGLMIVEATGTSTVLGKCFALSARTQEPLPILAEGALQPIQQLLWIFAVVGVIVNIIIIVYVELLSAPPAFLDVLSFAVVLLIASIPIALRVVCITAAGNKNAQDPSRTINHWAVHSHRQ